MRELVVLSAVVLALSGCGMFNPPASSSSTDISCEARRFAQQQRIDQGKASASTAVRCGDDNDAPPVVPS